MLTPRQEEIKEFTERNMHKTAKDRAADLGMNRATYFRHLKTIRKELGDPKFGRHPSTHAQISSVVPEKPDEEGEIHCAEDAEKIKLDINWPEKLSRALQWLEEKGKVAQSDKLQRELGADEEIWKELESSSEFQDFRCEARKAGGRRTIYWGGREEMVEWRKLPYTVAC